MATSWSDCLLVLPVPTRSASLRFRAYDHLLGTESLLSWAVRRLRAHCHEDMHVTIVSGPTEMARARGAVERTSSVTVRPWSGNGEIRDLHQFCVDARRTCLLAVDLSAALLSGDVWSRFLAAHAATTAHATCAEDLPCAVPPLLVERELLSALAADVMPGVPQDLRVALAGLEQLLQPDEAPPAIRLQRVTVVPHEEQERRGWPAPVRLETQDQVAILEHVQVLARAESPEAPADLLTHWIAAQQSRQIVRLRSLGPRAERSPRPAPNGGPPRVLFVSASSAFSGGEQALVLLAEGIRQLRGDDMPCAALIGEPGFLAERLSAAGVAVSTAMTDFARPAVRNYFFGRAEIDRVRPAIVHANSLAGAPFCCALADRGVPLVQHIRVANDSRLHELFDQMDIADAVIAVSAFVKRRIVRFGIPAAKVHVVYNGTVVRDTPAPSTADRVQARQQLGMAADDRIVLLVARFAANKRQDVVIEAFARLHETLPTAVLLCVGEVYDGRHIQEALTRQIDRRRLGDRVRFLGFQRDMTPFYRAADVLALASEDDPLPRTILEAMAARVPVVAASSGGVPEIITPEESGLLMPPGDSAGMAGAIRRLLEDEALHQRLAAAAWERCAREFDAVRCAAQVLDLYDHVLRDSAPVPIG